MIRYYKKSNWIYKFNFEEGTYYGIHKHYLYKAFGTLPSTMNSHNSVIFCHYTEVDKSEFDKYYQIHLYKEEL